MRFKINPLSSKEEGISFKLKNKPLLYLDGMLAEKQLTLKILNKKKVLDEIRPFNLNNRYIQYL